ncbi:MAG: hypothetical protein A2854_00465 [Parcubacteria group bacterium RIFCSPHIGHO2_01_FULL_56_18]|nr:MAG: hypothetical protein A2854_00465 [Parcubacteria group bacterium RIFCSPHIGHO2_01_FULL_56_18]
MSLVYALHPELGQFHTWEIPYFIGMLMALCMMLGAVVPGWEVDARKVIDGQSWTRMKGESLTETAVRLFENAIATVAAIGVLLFIFVFHFTALAYIVLTNLMQDMGAPGGAVAVMMVSAIFGWFSIPMAIAERAGIYVRSR